MWPYCLQAGCRPDKRYTWLTQDLTRVAPTMDAADEGVWSFGYGANMDMEALQSWKKVKVFEHCPAVLRGFKMVFSLPGLPFVEPGFGGLCRQEDEEVHGVAFKLRWMRKVWPSLTTRRLKPTPRRQ